MEKPQIEESHLLSFVTDASGSLLFIHADLRGVTLLIDELQYIRQQLELNDCPHTHLFSPTAGDNELTDTKVAQQESEVNVVYHVTIYGWNEEWAVRHGLKPLPSSGE